MICFVRRALLQNANHALRPLPQGIHTCSAVLCKSDSESDSRKEEFDFVDKLPPYPKFSKEERRYLYKGIIEENVKLADRNPPKVGETNPNEAPFDEIYADGPNRGNFTDVEVVTAKQPELWYWVERLLPKNIAPHPKPTGDELPSGYKPPAINPPDLPYFISRTRSKVLPVYKVITEKNTTLSYIGRKGVETFTVVRKIDGNARLFEKDLRSWLEAKHNTRIRSAVDEFNGSLKLMGDYVRDTVSWLEAHDF